jgi:hypothetical protein
LGYGPYDLAPARRPSGVRFLSPVPGSLPHHKKNHSLTTMSAADDQNTAITIPERCNNSGILTADAGRPAGWGWGSAIHSLVANNPTTPTAGAAAAIITTAAATAATTPPAATTEAGHFTESPSMTSLVADAADGAATRFVMSISDVLSLPDDQCKAKVVYAEHNMSLKVLVAMSRGLVDEAGEPLFDENAEPWCKVNPREWQSSRDDLAKEISRRWEDYVGKVEGKPRPKQWKKPAMLEWLINNPIATLGDGNGNTGDADCMFLRYQMGEVKKLRTVIIAEMAEQQALLEGNWLGPDPIIRLFHCIVDHSHILQKFRTKLQSMSRLSLENRNSDLSRDISVWEDISNIWNDPEYTPTTELFNNNLQQTEIPHSKVATLAKATPEKCESRFNAVVLNLKRIITMWERSGQGEGGFLHEEEEAQLGMNEFGSLAGRSENALSNRANFVGGNGKHFLYLWDLIDKYDLMKTCTQIIGSEFAAASGDNVRIIYDSKRAQLKDDEDDDASSMSSKQIKSEMSTFGGSIMKLATNNVMIAKMKAQEREKDRQEKEKDSLAAEEIHRNEVIEREKDLIEREKDRILQQKQSLEMEISRLRQDKRGYLIQMSERDEKRRKTR